MTIELSLLKRLAEIVYGRFIDNVAVKKRQQLNSVSDGENGSFHYSSKKKGTVYSKKVKTQKRMPPKKGRQTLSAERRAILEAEYAESLSKSRVSLAYDGTMYYRDDLAVGDGFMDVGKGKTWIAESENGEITFTERSHQYESSIDTIIQRSIAQWAYENGISVEMSSDGGELWDII